MIEITLKDSTINLLPAPRKNLPKLRGILVKLQTAWLLADGAVGDVVAQDKPWGMMKAAIALLPREDNPTACWEDLELLCNDYQQLQALFFGVGKVRVVEAELDLTDYTPSKFVEAHLFSPKQLLLDSFNEVLNGK